MHSHDKGMVSYLLQCDAASLKVTDTLQSVTRVLCLSQPSIILLSVFLYTYVSNISPNTFAGPKGI
jgi:hypothetical protein